MQISGIHFDITKYIIFVKKPLFDILNLFSDRINSFKFCKKYKKNSLFCQKQVTALSEKMQNKRASYISYIKQNIIF